MRALPLLGHPLLTCSAIRSLEARGLAATPEGTLMARAADAVADACASLLRTLPTMRRPTSISNSSPTA